MNWNDEAALARARYYLQQAGVPWLEELTLHNFLRFYDAVVDVIADMPAKQRDAVPSAWAARFSALGGDFDKKVKADPMLLYQPRTPKHAAVHESTAFCRYLKSANTIGKTLLAYADNIKVAQAGGNVVVVSTGHSVYSEKVFVAKMITGEDGDPFSPYVPDGGKWYHSFDQRKYLLRMACVRCAEAGKPKDCTHTRSIHCLSADSGRDRLMAFAAKQVHIDEHIPEDVYNELILRVRRPNIDGRMFVTATPLAGVDSWETKLLLDLYENRPEDNWLDLHTKATRYVDVFQISMWDCVGTPGGATAGEIEGLKARYSPSEYRVRVLGDTMPLGESMFNLSLLDKQDTENCRPAETGQLILQGDTTIEGLEYGADLAWQPQPHEGKKAFEGAYVWEPPEASAIYAIGADTASGTGEDRNDASSAYVFKLKLGANARTTTIEMVAAWYSHDDTYKYAEEVKKLATFYNMALVIPEVTGIGSAFMTALSRQLAYPYIFMGETPPEQAHAGAEAFYGIKTSAQSKPLMIEALKIFLDQNHILIRDKEAVSECRTFQKTRSESGLSYRYGAAAGAHDDRVLAMSFVAFAVFRAPDQIMALATVPTEKPPTFHDTDSKPPYWIM